MLFVFFITQYTAESLGKMIEKEKNKEKKLLSQSPMFYITQKQFAP